MTLIYCSPKAMAFVRFRRKMFRLDPEPIVHGAMVLEAAKGYRRLTTRYVRGVDYEGLPADLRAYVEKSYEEYVAPE